jgi:hypothetical protein
MKVHIHICSTIILISVATCFNQASSSSRISYNWEVTKRFHKISYNLTVACCHKHQQIIHFSKQVFNSLAVYIFESSSPKYNGHFSLYIFFRIYKLLVLLGIQFVMFEAQNSTVLLLFINVLADHYKGQNKNNINDTNRKHNIRRQIMMMMMMMMMMMLVIIIIPPPVYRHIFSSNKHCRFVRILFDPSSFFSLTNTKSYNTDSNILRILWTTKLLM